MSFSAHQILYTFDIEYTNGATTIYEGHFEMDSDATGNDSAALAIVTALTSVGCTVTCTKSDRSEVDYFSGGSPLTFS